VIASVLLKALQRAKELENSYDELTESGAYAGCLVEERFFSSLSKIQRAQLDG
jgi:hypothetical protein